MKRRKRMLEELEQDIRDHLERETQDNIARGMAPDEARYAALRKFGNVARVQEETREVWSSVWFEQLLQDVRYGFRLLRRSPLFALVAIFTLAIGIGANTAIFSLIDGVILRALPVENPSQLVVLKWTARSAPDVHGYMTSGDCPTDLQPQAANPSGCSFSEPMFHEIEEASGFTGVTAFANAGRLDLSGNGPASMIDGQVVSGGFFRTMGVKAAAGRVLQPSDDSPSASPVAVLDYGYWQIAFGGSRDAIGRTIELNNVPFTIVGVARQQFTGITPGSDYDVWLPLSKAQRISDPVLWQNRQDDLRYWWLTIVGRIQPGTQIAQTQAQVSGLFRNETLHGPVQLFHGGETSGGLALRPGGPPPGGARREMFYGGPPPAPGAKRPVPEPAPVTSAASPQSVPKTLYADADNPQVALVPAHSGLTGERSRYTDPLFVLMLAVGIILLIACANVAGLLLARAAARQKEMAVRLALGAGRARVVRQLLTESLMLSVLGGALGIFFAYWGAHAIISFVSTIKRVRSDSRPAWTSASWHSPSRCRCSSEFFSVSLPLFAARASIDPSAQGRRGQFGELGTFARKVVQRRQCAGGDPGRARHRRARGRRTAGTHSRQPAQRERWFRFAQHPDFRDRPDLIGYKGPQIDSFYRDLQGRLSETPGVKSASYSMMPLLSNGLMITVFHWPGTPQDQESDADILGVGPNFFETLHIPFRAGRGFNASDFELAASNSGDTPTSAPTPVIVNQAFVEKYLGHENPLGKQFGESPADANGPASPGYEIVGVVRDAKYNSLRREIHATIYEPQHMGGASFELRTAADPKAILPAIREVVAEVNPNLPLFSVTTESEQIDRLLFQERLVARLSSFFGFLALLLACIGLYGLLAYEVTRRTREIGIRMALGAHSSDVLRLVVGQGLALAAAGAAIGIGVALGVMRFLHSLLYGVKPADPLTFIAVALFLAAVALFACYIPARRAMRVDPIVALRYE